MTLTLPQRIALAFFVLISVLWVWIHVMGYTEGTYNYVYSFVFGLIPLLGGITAIRLSSVWGGMKSAIGKAVLFVGIGVFLWGCGETIWSYYNFFAGVAAPYPSLADLGFAPSIFFYGIGAIYLAQATGAKFAFRHPYAKWLVFVAFAAVMLLSYYVLIVVARGGVLVPEGETALKSFLDIVYPLGDLLAAILAVIISGLSFPYLGGRYRLNIYAILAGLAVMFLADSIFSYTTTIETYYNANLGDLILSLGTFLLTFGVLGFTRPKIEVTSKV
ncbi:MAG: hypothetical protein JWL75_613 [Parcubacteria group bacterium]|nr:hypothetical protein [Parcubacteria group bacterium]